MYPLRRLQSSAMWWTRAVQALDKWSGSPPLVLVAGRYSCAANFRSLRNEGWRGLGDEGLVNLFTLANRLLVAARVVIDTTWWLCNCAGNNRPTRDEGCAGLGFVTGSSALTLVAARTMGGYVHCAGFNRSTLVGDGRRRGAHQAMHEDLIVTCLY